CANDQAQGLLDHPLSRVMTAEREERERVVAAARSWIGTKYHHRARIRGVGVDCATLLVAVYAEAGVLPPFDLPAYSPPAHLNHDDEKYLAVVLEHCGEVERPDTGDMVLWRFGRTLSHGAIVVEWPTVIHASWGAGVMLDNAEMNYRLSVIGQGEAGCGKPRD